MEQRQQRKLVANAMQQLEGQQADLTRQMANDLEKIMQKHQSEMQQLQAKLREREETLHQTCAELERMQSLNREYEEEIAKLREEKEKWRTAEAKKEEERGNEEEREEGIDDGGGLRHDRRHGVWGNHGNRSKRMEKMK